MTPVAEFEGLFGTQYVRFQGNADIGAERLPEDDLMDLTVDPDEVGKLEEAQQKSWRRTMNGKLKVTFREDGAGDLKLNGKKVDDGEYEFETDCFWKLSIYPR